MSLIIRLSSCFLSFTRTTQRWVRQQTSGHHTLVTNLDPDTTDRAIFTIAALFSHTGKTPDWDTHTQTHSTTAVSLNAASDFWIHLQHAPVFPALHAIFEGLFKASCFPTVSLNNSGELFCQYYSSAAFTSRRRQANQSSTVSLSAFTTFKYSLLYFPISQRQYSNASIVARYSIPAVTRPARLSLHDCQNQCHYRR